MSIQERSEYEAIIGATGAGRCGPPLAQRDFGDPWRDLGKDLGEFRAVHAQIAANHTVLSTNICAHTMPQICGLSEAEEFVVEADNRATPQYGSDGAPPRSGVVVSLIALRTHEVFPGLKSWASEEKAARLRGREWHLLPRRLAIRS